MGDIMQEVERQGEHVEGTFLSRHGELRASRRSATDRAARAWYECELCGEFKCFKVKDVRPGCCVSCGCKGRRQFTAHMERRAENLPKQTKYDLFSDYTGKRIGIYGLAQMYRLSRYVIQFAVNQYKRYLLSLKASWKTLKSVLTRVELHWLGWKRRAMEHDAVVAQRRAYLDAMHWRDREKYLEMEREECAKMTVEKFNELYAAALKDEDKYVVEIDVWRPLAYVPA
jgi:hypothetical protein